MILWEEIKKQKKKKMKNESSVKIDIIKETKIELKTEILDIITPKYRKNCPKCNREMTYCDAYKLSQSIKKETVCIHCCQLKDKAISTIATTRNCPSCNKLLTYKSNDHYRRACKLKQNCKSCTHIGYKHKDESKKKMSIGKSGINNPHFGKVGPFKGNKHNQQTKLKLRLYTIKQRQVCGDVFPLFNPVACKFIDEYGKAHDYKFQHALNGGEFYIKELGYFVDGYDSEKNVIFEYDERHHFSGDKLKQKDIERMNQIKNHLKCKFIRYNEKINEIVEY